MHMEIYQRDRDSLTCNSAFSKTMRDDARRCVTMRDDAWIFGGDSSNNGEIFVSTLLQDETTMEMAVPIIWTYLKDIVRGIFYLGQFPLSLKLMLCDSWVGGVSGYRLWRASQSMFQIAIGWIITQSLRVAWVYLEIGNNYLQICRYV